MLDNLNGTPNIPDFVTPGKTSYDLRNSLITISNDIEFISKTFKNSFAILKTYNGTLQGLTDCYIARR